MKKLTIIVFSIFLLLFICSCSSEVSHSEKAGRMSNLKGIQDFSTLKSIGAGIISSGGSRAVSSADSLKLVGIDESGAYKVVSFYDENGETITQSYSLINFRDFYSYVLFQFAPPEFFSWMSSGEIDWSKGCGNFDENSELYYHDYFSMRYKWSAINNYLAGNTSMRNEFMVYVLDKNTGKIYELVDSEGNMIYPSFYWDPSPDSMGAGLYFSTKNYAGFVDYNVALDENRTTTKTNYRMSIQDGNIKLEKLQSSAAFNGWESGGRNDKYGNCYSKNYKYLINNNGQLKSIGDGTDCFMGLNSIFYVGNQWVNEEGNLEAAGFIPASTYHCDDPENLLVKTVGNVLYYLENDHVMKITYLSDDYIEYNVERIELENYDDSASYSISVGRIVYISESAIAYYSPEDGVKHVLSDQYFYNSMSVKLDGTIEFSGVDSDFNVVEGVILADGSISTSVTPAAITMITISALN